MKRMTLLLTLILVMCGLSAQAEMYKVKKGDTLWKISQQFHVDMEVLWRVNRDRVSDKDLIYVGQKLKIPQDNFHYRSPNTNPFTAKRDPARLIRKFDCPAEIKEEFIETAEQFLGRAQYYRVRKGDTLWKLADKFEMKAEKIYQANRDIITHPKKWLFPEQVLVIPTPSGPDPPRKDSGRTVFLSSKEGHINFLSQMGFGDYQVVSDVQVDFADPRKARLWSFRLEQKVYYLVLPENCFNWGWHKRPVLKKKYSLPSPEVEKTEKEPSPSQGEWRPELDVWTYGGQYQGHQGGNNENWHQYGGGHASLFLYSRQVGSGRFRIGPSVQYLAWQGEVDNAIDYSGDLKLIGGEIEYLADKYNLSLMTFVGEKRGWVEGKDFPYRSREEADMLVFEGSYEWWYNRTWFQQMELGTRLQFASNEARYSYWDGNPIEDPVVQQGEYSGRFKTDIYSHYVATPTIEVGAGWREFDKSAFLEPRFGIEWFRDTFATDFSWQIVEHSQNNMFGVHLRIDLGKVGRKATQ